ncbi:MULTISPECIES: hypothetical protein [Acinetobacter]|uniref:hypothetical protein n=1 Tax=Acinetobacter TaxID=469 RepID=UPI00034705A3|nr:MULTISPECIES: hypothetical protein [Acinetobacter]MBJ8428147.1 hypothetical protein [Acinetobacter bereziniae]
MSVSTLNDSEKTITLPDVIEFESGESVPIEEVSVAPVYDEDRVIVAINITAEVEGSGTVTNHVSVGSFDVTNSDVGLFNENPDNYEHPVDDCSYDTENPISDETLDKIIVIPK